MLEERTKRPEREQPAETQVDTEAPPRKSDFEPVPVSLEWRRAEDFLESRARTGKKIGLGIALMIAGPAALLFQIGLAVWFRLPRAVYALCEVPLLACVALGVWQLATSGMPESVREFSDILHNKTLLDEESYNYLLRERDESFPANLFRPATGVAMIIASIILLLLMVIPSRGRLALFGVSAMLLCIAAGVYTIIASSYVRGAYALLMRSRERLAASFAAHLQGRKR